VEEKAADDAEAVKGGIRHARPRMSMIMLAFEAAAHFGIAPDEFMAKPLVRRAEMIAHLVLIRQRENYEADLVRKDADLVRKREADRKKPSAINPEWMLGKS
jgi:hypothetical protein